MRVKRAEGAVGVGGGPQRSVEIRVSFSPSEYAVVAAEAERQGWSVGGWVGALAECAERLGPAPEGGGLDAVAWGRVGERAGSLTAAGRVLADAGVEECGQALERAAHRLSLMCRAQAFAVRNTGAEHNLEAARRGELVAMQLGAGFRHREGESRRRVKVMLTERAVVVVRNGVGSTGGWTPSDWIGSVAAAASGWLAVSARDEAREVEAWLKRLSAVRTVLIGIFPGRASAPLEASRLAELATWAEGEVRAVEQGLMDVVRWRERGPLPGAGSQRSLNAVMARMAWDRLQLGLNVTGWRHDDVVIVGTGA